MDDLQARAKAAFDALSDEDMQRALLVIEAMQAGIEIDPADFQGKSPAELREYADRLRQMIDAGGREN